MEKTTKRNLFAIFMALSLFLVACSTSSNGNGNNADTEDLKVIKYAKQAPGMTTIDAQLSTTSDVIQPARLITESLLTFDADRNLVPLLVKPGHYVYCYKK